MKVFVTYRRNDSSLFAEPLHDYLSQRYDLGEIFWDRNTIAPGADFSATIQQSLLKCKVVIVLIGKQWLSAADKDGKRRLDKPDDYVRLEIALALRHHKLVIPLLVDGARMPHADELPPDIAELATRNSFSINTGPAFANNMQRLCKQIDKQFRGPTNDIIFYPLTIALMMNLYANSKEVHLTGSWIDLPTIYCWMVAYGVSCMMAVSQVLRDKCWL